MNADRIVLTDAMRARIEHMLPDKATDPVAVAVDNRRILEAVLWRTRTMFNPDLTGQNHTAKKWGSEKLPELPANPASVKSALCKRWRVIRIRKCACYSQPL